MLLIRSSSSPKKRGKPMLASCENATDDIQAKLEIKPAGWLPRFTLRLVKPE